LQGLAGTVFSPPHWRGRGTASWRTGALTLTADLNYTGSERDTRGARAVAVGAMTTAGLTARWQVPSTFLWLKGLDLSASVQNLFDAKPPLIVRRSTQDAPFDSTNVSATGRFLSFAVRKTW
jgi:outer membrane receptor protein involved in Fe transport